MRVLFIYDNIYSAGGVQTWLTRVLPRLRERGHQVGLLTRPRGRSWDVTDSFFQQLSRDAEVRIGGKHWFSPPAAVAPQPPADVLFACNLPALLLAAGVQQHMMPAARIVAGVFHPREYCWRVPLRHRRWDQHLAERVLGGVPVANFMFSGDGMARVTGGCLGRDLGAAPVVPLPIDTERLRPPAVRVVEPGKVVSVTRLAPYYTHHLQMIRVIRDLRGRGHNFSYHAYGDGEERPRLEQEARRLGVEHAVHLPGTIPYERFEEVVGDAFAYIGLGTALIEAAACGVPALVGIDGLEQPDTYGLIQDTIGNDIGGYVPGHPQYPIAERLLWLSERSDAEYRDLEFGARARAEEFSLTGLVPRLEQALSGSRSFAPGLPRAARALGRLDWLREAVLLNLGARDVPSARYARSASA